MSKELIKLRHPFTVLAESAELPFLTYKDKNSLWYIAGYIPRMLRKRLKKKSTHPLKDDSVMHI